MHTYYAVMAQKHTQLYAKYRNYVDEGCVFLLLLLLSFKWIWNMGNSRRLNISIVRIVDFTTFTRIHYARNKHVLGAVASTTMWNIDAWCSVVCLCIASSILSIRWWSGETMFAYEYIRFSMRKFEYVRVWVCFDFDWHDVAHQRSNDSFYCIRCSKYSRHRSNNVPLLKSAND